MYGGQEKPGGSAFDGTLKILGKPPIAVEPSKRTFNHPSAGQYLEALCGVGSLDDLHCPVPDFHQGRFEFLSGVATIGKNMTQPGIQRADGFKDVGRTVTILNVRRMDDGTNQEALGIGDDMALASFDFLARIIAGRVDRAPPFSALLTLWLSMIAAVGLASRPACSRQRT